MCAVMGFIGRNIQATLSLDPCSYEMTIGIETMESTISLLEFKWGVLQYFSLQGGLRLE
jgi:hypothetical protein